MNLDWDNRRNLENSLADFLEDEITTQNITVPDQEGNPIEPQVRVGFKKEDDWILPNIAVYVDSVIAPRLSVGGNKRQKEYLVIIDIRACDIGSQLDLVEFVNETINNGWNFFEYSPNGTDPENPTRVKTGFVSFNFVSDTAVRFGENVDLFDKYRQNTSISCTITPTA